MRSASTANVQSAIASAPFKSAADVKLWLSERFARESDPHRLIAVALEAVGRYLGVSRVAYGEIDEALEWMTVAVDWTDGEPSKTGRRLFERGSAFASHYRAGRTMVIADSEESALDTGSRDQLARGSVRALIGVPLVEDGRLAAVFNATMLHPRAWTEDEVVLVADVATRLWGTLKHLATLERLRESEEQFRLLAENMPGLCWLAGPDGRAYWGNRRWQEFFGDNPITYDSSSWTVHPDDRERAVEIWANALQTGEACEMQVRVRGASADYRPFLCSSSPIRDGQGQVARWCGVMVDLTEHLAQDRRQSFLRAYSDATRDETDAATILTTASEMLIEEMRIGQVTYSEVTADDTIFNVFLARPGRRFDEKPASFRFAEGFASLLDHYRQGRTLVVGSYDDDLPQLTGPVLDARRQVGMCASINVPLVKEGRLVALLSATDPTPRDWSRDEIQLIEELSDRVWASVSRARAEAALLERERNQAFLIEWSDRVRHETVPGTIMSTTLDMIGEYLGSTRTTYSESDASGRVFTILGEWRNGVSSLAGTKFLLDDVGVTVDREWTAGGIVRYDDVTTDPRIDAATAPSYLAAEILAFVSVPLLENGRVRSALSVQQGKARHWRDSEIQLLREIAERTWVTLERARASAVLLDRDRSQAFLIEWSDALRNEGSPRGMLATTLDAIGRHFGVTRANYAESTDAGDALCVLQEWRDGAVSVVGQSFPLAALGERVLADHLSGEPVQVDDIAIDPRFDDRNRPMYEAIGVRAFLSVPMVRRGEIVAVLSIQQDTPRSWRTAETNLLRELADRTWAVLERAMSEQRLAVSEAQLAAFLENAPVAMHLKDGDGRYVRVNPEFARALGRPREELQGMHPDELFPPDLAAEIDRIERRALAGEVASAEIEFGEGDAYFSALAMVFPIAGTGGLARTAGFTLDLTERKRVEAALTRSRETLYQTEKLSALGSLLAGVSHELNNPLSIVVAQAVMMERQARNGELADRAQKIRRAADRCARIVQTFLAMARQEQPERRPVNLNAIVTAAHDLTAYGLRSDGITTDCKLAVGLPLISADSDQLHQIVINLIINAQQAMVEDGGTDPALTLRTARGKTPGTLILEVSDNGPGISEEVRRRIFEPFFTTKPQGQGTGIGLSFSQGLAEAHGGRLELVPTKRGACFRLTLPIEKQAMVPDAPADANRGVGTASRRALVVDDEREIAEALADFLSIEGFATDIAIGGADAKQRIAHSEYDLIVSDLRMPGIDGPDLYAWIAAEHPDLADRVAFATGDTLGLAAARFLETVDRPVLEKPFTPDTVRRFLAEMDLA